MATQAAVLAFAIAFVAENLHWMHVYDQPLQTVWTRWAFLLGEKIAMPEVPAIPPNPTPSNLSFAMGEHGNVHNVTFAGVFAVGSTEVTFAQYDAFADATGRQRPSDSGWGRGSRPVINVDWSNARDYARWLGNLCKRHCSVILV